MKIFISALFLSLVLVLSGCGDKQETVSNAPEAVPSTTSQAPVASTKSSEPVAESQTSMDDMSEEEIEKFLKLGMRSFIRCRSCHTLGLEEPHTVGPNLNALFGSAAGKREGFNYSEALAGSDIKWTKETLKAWLKSPSTYIPGNKMAFAGIQNEKELEALLAYLEKNTQ